MSYTDLTPKMTPIDPIAANAQFTPAADPAQAMKSPGGPLAPSAIQPRETVAGSDGSMVVSSPSASGSGAPVFGAGTRGLDAGS
jgi:hypothetical protein